MKVKLLKIDIADVHPYSEVIPELKLSQRCCGVLMTDVTTQEVATWGETEFQCSVCKKYRYGDTPNPEPAPAVPPGVVVPRGMRYTRTEMMGGYPQHCFIEDKPDYYIDKRQKCVDCGLPHTGDHACRTGGGEQQTARDLPLTELPDGSGCFTATILSDEEALALPTDDTKNL